MKKLIFIITVWMVALSQNALGSTRVGNGGGVLVCKDSAGNTTVTLLDLYEATERYGLTLAPLAGSIDQIMQSVYAKVDKTLPLNGDGKSTFRFLIEGNVKLLQEKVQFIPKDRKLQLIDDANYLMLPINCERQQLAILDDVRNLYIDSNLFNKLDDYNKAALFIHEAIYYLQRDRNKVNTQFDEITSDTVRKSVAYLFSTATLENVVSEEALNNGVYCRSKENKVHQEHAFFAYLKDDKIEIEFMHIFNENMITKTSIEWAPYDFSDGDNSPHYGGYLFASDHPKSIMQADSNSLREDSYYVIMLFNKPTAAKENLLSRIKGISVSTMDSNNTEDIADLNCVPSSQRRSD